MNNWKNHKPENQGWQRRIAVLTGGVFLFAIIIFVRLFQHSIIDHKKYTAMAEDQYTMVKTIEPKRGEILAQDFASGEEYPIATNLEEYDVNIIPKNVKNKQEVSEKLATIIDMKREEILEKMDNSKLYIPPIKKKVGKNVKDKIIALKLDGVLMSSDDVRIYPEDNFAGQVLGFVNDEGKGNYGIEGYYDSILRGEGGTIIAEKDAKGNQITDPNPQQNIQDGSSLLLTIDHNVQYTVEQKLKESIDKYSADNGSVIIMDPKTGAIIAMASYPSYDPNKFNEAASNQDIFINPAIAKVWEPGSILKAMTMGAALDLGKVEPDTEEIFSNMTVVQGYEIHTAQDKAFGRETMTQVLENSDNVAMVWVADKIGNDDLYEYLEKFGYGKETEIDLSGEVAGSIPKLANWNDIARSTISFGQGVSLTPLEVLVAYAAIANGGKYIKPYVVEKVIKSSGEEINTQPKIKHEVIKPEIAAKLTGMLVSVVERGHGKMAKVPGFSVAGKTGTAQIPKPEGGYYEDKHTGSFAGFLPASDPKFAMIVRLENPKNVEWAESSAAPTFGEIAQWLVNYYQIPPTQ